MILYNMTEETLKIANDLVDKIEGLKDLDKVLRTYSSDKYLHVRFESLLPEDLKITINNSVYNTLFLTSGVLNAFLIVLNN